MKKNTILFFLLITGWLAAQQQNVAYSIAPAAFEETTSITITINASSVNEVTWGVVGNALYLWAWSLDTNDANSIDCPTNGTWTVSNEANKFTYNSGTDTYTKTFVPTTFYNRIGIGRIGFLVKAKNGTGDKKSQDIFAEVGLFQVNLTAPVQNSTTLIGHPGSLNISANNTGGAASYNLKANGVSIHTQAATANYTFNHTNITVNTNYELDVTLGGTTVTKMFSVLLNPGTLSEAIPGRLEDGINYNVSDGSKATLVLSAPGKDFIYVAGSFNGWNPNSNYAMKKDPSTGKFWLELNGLTVGQTYTYQYWVADVTPIAGSPVLVKTADPFSTLVLSPYDDPSIPAGSYPNMPAYPAGQEREVTVLQTNQPVYNWQVTDFTKPAKEDLIVYEVLTRDFDSHRTYQDLIDKIDYFKNLNVNAIELMPVMEFEGNESWGYNTAFHMANDKFYGPGSKLKEFIDLCHQNDIAVILDVALNHVFGRNPMVRMWMNDPDGDGWGGPSSDNPYFNLNAMHSYSVGNDFNHSLALTRAYTKRVIKHWIEEYHIDGFRWDLTKGFTQECPVGVTGGQEACTNGYRADRVAILKEYADYSWNLDPTHYVIFEHLGTDNEEQQWANYRINESPSKGVMLWAKMTDNYNQLSMGFASGSDITRMGNTARGFTAKRAMGYTESHDEERLMYKNLTFGNNANASHNVRNLNTALSRMSAIGAISLLVPGPKMIWHFGELGWEPSIFTCNNGTVNTPTDATSGDCKLDTKPQPQWANNWIAEGNRAKIYNDWSRMIGIKRNEPVFKGTYTINSGTTLTPKLRVTDASIPTTQLRDVIVLTNFDTTIQNIIPDFPYAGTWYNLMDNSEMTVMNTSAPISIAAGQFLIYGNKPATLNTNRFAWDDSVSLYPNPSSDYFRINANTAAVSIYSVTGQLIRTFAPQSEQHQYNISDLTNGFYLVKAIDTNRREKTMRLIKQ